MKTIAEIYELLEKEEFSEAEEALFELRRNGENRPIIDYLIGCLYDDYNNPNRSSKNAKRYFSSSIKTDRPFEDAFIRLARLEHSRNHTMRILQQGIRQFPKSIRLYEMLLNWTESEKRSQLYHEICDKGLVSNSSKATMIRTYLELRNFEEALDLIKEYAPTNQDQAMFLDLLCGFCLYETDQVRSASDIFRKLIDSDLTIALGYAQYFGLILCFLKTGDDKKALNIFSDIKIEDEFTCPFDYDFGPIDQIYLRYSESALSQLNKRVQDRKTKAKARGIRAIIGGDEQFGYDISRKRILSDLRFANKYLPDNIVFCGRLIDHSIEDNDPLLTHSLTLQYLRNVAWDERKKAVEDTDYSYIDLASEKDFNQIKDQIRALIKKRDYIDLQVLAPGPCVPLIGRLFKNNEYREIADLADALGNAVLNVPEILFDVAYSYGEILNPEKSKMYYEAYNNHNPNSPSVLNNLGVLYEGEGNFTRAKELYEKAYSLERTSELYKRNSERIISSERSALTIMHEPIAVKKHIVALWYEQDMDEYLPDPNKLLAKTLSIQASEASNAVKQLVRKSYIIAVKKPLHNYECSVYRINPFIGPKLALLEAEVQRATEILDVADEITPDSLDRIGYDDQLTSCLKKVVSYELQQLLQRDLREAAFSILTKSFKTTLVLSGSIIEAVLLDIVTAKNILKYKMPNGKNKSVSRMDLGELLIVAEAEGLINNELFHLAHALRGFRNLIHPGLERRKTAIAVTEQNAKIAWDITRKLLLEL